MKSSVFDTLKDRGFIYQATHEDEIRRAIDGPPITFYLGIDPTADSLHIGHFFALMMFRRLQEAGHKGILVIGGATALVGDPSGKSDLRKLLSKEEVERNLEEVKTLAKRFIKVDGDNPAIIVNNADWINPYSYIDFMREIGIHFNVNTMLTAETYAKRLEEGGLTFLEMGYMLMQAYDFVYLNRNYGCTLQIGGSDQWGNIVAGVNLGRKLNYLDGIDENIDKMFGLTNPLLMTKEGKKMGKTEQGTLWVARKKTTVFDFYQYFYNVNDEDTEMLLKLFTSLPSEQIEEQCKNDIVAAKRLMAYEITKLVHGAAEADKVIKAVGALFGNSMDLDNVPSYKIDRDLLVNGINIVDVLTLTNFMPSKSEARRVIQQGGVAVNGKKIDNAEVIVDLNSVDNGCILLKKGKKNFLKVYY
ncbi:MAG: tyrosine--tRNA ligase [Thermacetogeniaceae bacterium]|jgi:tyrosyl-tRNA synthetase